MASADPPDGDPLSTLIDARCVSCGRTYDCSGPLNTCEDCGSMLSCRYDYEKAKETMRPSSLGQRGKDLWRYFEVLPLRSRRNLVTLGEGYTPVIRLANGLLLKDDGQIPTGTFKARGMAVAVSKAKELGLKRLAVPSAGNAGSAMACYAARAGMSAKVYMPIETPQATVDECRAFGAQVTQVKGNIGDAGARMKLELDGSFDMSTLKEPYRLEGKKTMGYEIAEQTMYRLPHVVIYPTGGGTGLIGMWKAFEEMEKLGWIGQERPRMFSVQSESCAPVVEAFSSGRESLRPDFSDGLTVATGLRVPRPFAGKEILEVLRRSKGGAVAVPDGKILKAAKDLARRGVFACPEGAATFAAYAELLGKGTVAEDEECLLYNTGTGLKYLNLFK